MSRFLPEQHKALRRIIKERTCPPLDILAQGGAEVEAHLKVCPECRESLELLPLYQKFSEKLPELGIKPPVQSPLAPGQVRSLLRTAVSSIQRGHVWYTPPLVLVLDTDTGVPGMARVAQIHDAFELQAEGDVALDAEYEDSFAESWNTYPAFAEYLSPVLSEVPATVVQQVLDGTDQGLPTVEEHSPIGAFRMQEMETGAFFAHPALGRALALQKAQQAEKASATQQNLWEQARNWLAEQCGKALPSLNALPELALAASPAMAEVGMQSVRVKALLGIADRDDGEGLRSLLVQLIVESLPEDVMLTGKCPWPADLPQGSVQACLFIALSDGSVQSIAAPCQWVGDNLEFYASVPAPQWDETLPPQIVLVLERRS